MLEDFLLLFDNFSVPFLFLLVLVVEAGVPVPIPYDILILAAGYRQINFLNIIVAVVLGNLIGSTILYLISRKLGYAVLLKGSKFLGVGQKRLELFEGWFEKWGAVTIVLARLVPGFRFAATVFSGVFSLPYFKIFLPYLLLGSVLWVSLYWTFGAVFGESIRVLIQVLGIWSAFLTVVLILLVAFLAAGIYKKRYDRRSTDN